MVSITKTKTTIYKILSSRPDMMKFCEEYRQIRGSFKYRGFECFNCNYRFKDGDGIGLTITDKGNRVLCNKCAIEFKRKLDKKSKGESK